MLCSLRMLQDMQVQHNFLGNSRNLQGFWMHLQKAPHASVPESSPIAALHIWKKFAAVYKGRRHVSA
jgi:hypothetical protein